MKIISLFDGDNQFMYALNDDTFIPAVGDIIIRGDSRQHLLVEQRYIEVTGHEMGGVNKIKLRVRDVTA